MELINFNKEVVLLFVGGLISLITSVVLIIVQKLLNNHGKINIFYKFTYLNDDISCGLNIDKNSGRKALMIPISFEFQNTSNSNKVIRNINLLLCNGNKIISEMKQAEYSTQTQENTLMKNEYGTYNNSYSFCITPLSIIKEKCLYIFKIDSNKNGIDFDNIKLRYYDERNKEKIFLLKMIDKSRFQNSFKVDGKWNLVE